MKTYRYVYWFLGGCVMKRNRMLGVLVFGIMCLGFLGYVLWGRGKTSGGSGKDREELVVYTSHQLDFLRPLIEEFESRTGILVKIFYGGTGEMIQRIEEEQDSPVGDILWGGSLSTLTPQKYLFEEYISMNEEMVWEEFKNWEGMFTKFSDIPSILMVNTDLIGNIRVEGYGDLLNPELKGKIAYCNPAISSSAFEHLINILYAMGDWRPKEEVLEEGQSKRMPVRLVDADLGWDFVESFCDNLDGNLLKSSTEVYESVVNGKYVVGLIFEDAAASLVANGENIRIVYMEEGVLSTPDCVSLIKNAPHSKNAKAFIDYVTGYEVQTIMAMERNRRPVRKDVVLPDYLKKKDEIAIIHADRTLIYEKKQEWLLRFREIFFKLEEN